MRRLEYTVFGKKGGWNVKGLSRPTASDRVEVPAQEDPSLHRQAEVLRALSHPARLRIIQHLRDGEHCVCEFEALLGLRQPNISQHLSSLRAANLVTTRRGGLRVLYSLADPAILDIVDAVAEVVRRQGATLAAALAQGFRGEPGND